MQVEFSPYLQLNNKNYTICSESETVVHIFTALQHDQSKITLETLCSEEIPVQGECN